MSEVTWTIGTPSGDAEIDAMRIVKVAMEVGGLGPSAKRRIVQWAYDRWNPQAGDDDQ